MSTQQKLYAAIKAMSGQARILTIPRLFVTLTKSHRAALVLSQCIYWSDKSRIGGGWFYKSFAEWHEELGIPKQGMMTAVRALTNGGWLEVQVKKAGGAPTTHYRVVMSKLADDLGALFDSTETVLSDSTENGQSSIA